jgi:predicted aspartyl protease
MLSSRPVSASNCFPSARRTLSIFLASMALATELLGASQAPPVSAQLPPQFEALPLVRSRQNHLLVRAYINGKPAWLCVDSGAPVSAIALDRRGHFGLTGIPGSSKLPPRLQINGGFSNVAIARHFRLGALNLIDEPVVTIDLGGPTRAARLVHEQQIDGILGADILFPTNAVLDCQQQVLVLKMDPDVAGSAPGLDFRGFRSTPIHVSDAFNLYVDSSINGMPAKLMIDTGAFATLLHRSFVHRLQIPVRETPFTSAAVNLKQRDVQVARVRRLSVASVNIRGKDVGVIDMEGLLHNGLLEASPPVAGLLGAEILRQHHGIIDFGTRTLYLKR